MGNLWNSKDQELQQFQGPLEFWEFEGLLKKCGIPIIPPHQGSGAGIAIKGDAWVSGWYPAATELTILKGIHITKLVRRPIPQAKI